MTASDPKNLVREEPIGRRTHYTTVRPLRRTMAQDLSPGVIKLMYAVYGRSNNAENTFIQELQQILRKNDLHCVKISGNAEERNNAATSYASSRLPLLLFCVASTRVGTDAKAALDMYTGTDQNTILVILNHKPNTKYQEDQHSGSSIHDVNVSLVVDCFFWESDGLYRCENNTRAVNQVADFLSPYLPRHAPLPPTRTNVKKLICKIMLAVFVFLLLLLIVILIVHLT